MSYFILKMKKTSNRFFTSSSTSNYLSSPIRLFCCEIGVGPSFKVKRWRILLRYMPSISIVVKEKRSTLFSQQCDGSCLLFNVNCSSQLSCLVWLGSNMHFFGIFNRGYLPFGLLLSRVKVYKINVVGSESWGMITLCIIPSCQEIVLITLFSHLVVFFQHPDSSFYKRSLRVT